MDIPRILPYLQHPLVLIGFVLLLVFGVHRALIRSGLIPPLDRRSGGAVLATLLRYGFILALAVVVLGFGIQYYQTSRVPNVDELNGRLGTVLNVLSTENVSQAARVQLGSEKDRKELEAKILRLKEGMAKEGVARTPESFYLLGNAYAALGQFDNAKAAFLEATKQEPKYARAYLGLAIVHQLEANYSLQAANLGTAESALAKAEGYLKTAQQFDATDPDTSTQLGYIYKDLAQRFRAAGHDEKVPPTLDAAERLFRMALGPYPNDPSAWNGLGDVDILRGDYDGAISAYQKAVKLEPDYLYAQYGLAMAYYTKASQAHGRRERVEALRGMVAPAQKAVELQEKGDKGRLPPEALNQLVQATQWAATEVTSVARSLAVPPERTR